MSELLNEIRYENKQIRDSFVEQFSESEEFLELFNRWHSEIERWEQLMNDSEDDERKNQFATLARKCAEANWFTVGVLCEIVRQSWLANMKDTRFGYKFSHLCKKEQYKIIQRVVNSPKWERALGANDGREVRVYRLARTSK